MTERPLFGEPIPPLEITEQHVRNYPSLESFYYEQRYRRLDAGERVWVQRDFDSTEEAVFDYRAKDEDTRAYILVDLRTEFCRSWISLQKEGQEDQDVTGKKKETLDEAQQRLEYIVSKIPTGTVKPEKGEPQLPSPL